MDGTTFYRLSIMPEDKKCELINSGLFNEIITGYAILGAEAAESLSMPIERVMSKVFDEYTAADALAKVREY